MDAKPSWDRKIVRVLACGVLAISVMAIVGYLLKTLWLLHWVGNEGMAFNTAVSLMLVAFCLLIISRHDPCQ